MRFLFIPINMSEAIYYDFVCCSKFYSIFQITANPDTIMFLAL